MRLTTRLAKKYWDARLVFISTSQVDSRPSNSPKQLLFCRLKQFIAVHSSGRAKPQNHWRKLHLPLHVVDEFDELEMGDWTNRTLSELDLIPEWHKWNTQRSENVP